MRNLNTQIIKDIHACIYRERERQRGRERDMNSDIKALTGSLKQGSEDKVAC